MSRSSRSDRANAAIAGLAHLARAAGPWLQRAARRGGTGLRAGGRLAIRHRRSLYGVGLRLMWWSALVLLVLGGQSLLNPAVPERGLALAPFAVGLGLCAVVRLLAARGHLRFAALGLGALHGTAAVLVWTAFGG